ncbi:MAG: hypothetical protein A2266_10570 [Bacteroidetes bacterium RIFOXYA12_FULL_40_10]|nr:MAG: hypothetical protein A2266_10570 [Bacteroidetes bacterium RIFOXYA12_FULL_40_10]
MEEKNLSKNESLELIARMIKETRNSMERGGGNIYLLWGYLWLVVALTIYGLLLYTGDYRATWLWFAMPLVGYPAMYFMLKSKKGGVVTFVGAVISKIWIVIGVCALLLSLFMFVNHNAFPIMFIMALLINAGVAMSGLVIKFKPTIIAGFVGILLSFSLLLIPGINQILVFAAFSVIMLIIPGHILNAASRKANAAGLDATESSSKSNKVSNV